MPYAFTVQGLVGNANNNKILTNLTTPKNARYAPETSPIKILYWVIGPEESIIDCEVNILEPHRNWNIIEGILLK